ncbi:MAG TPA: hypothetical protein VK043_08145 [Burkholderiales bacterium]|nr:hypothetical protein [Burkholderiales bacterium]
MSKKALLLLGAMLASLISASAAAMPVFARQYDLSCSTCHVAYPRLNAFGEQFAGRMNMRMPDWRDKMRSAIRDDELALPQVPPLAVRAQANVQAREGEEIDPVGGPKGNRSGLDFQSPYLIKLLSSAPLSENITYYFYGIFAEKGRNGEALIEDAWFRHGDVFGTGVSAQLGQFQLSDLMFPRETRMTFQDFVPYRMAGITYDRGVLFSRELGPLDTALGFVNGNGINANFTINSPGFQRPDRMFDHDSRKTVFGRIGMDVGPVGVGLFGARGRQRNAVGPAGTGTGDRNADKRVVGIDLSGDIGGKFFWFAQGLWNRWDGILEPGKNYRWFGGFAGVDYVPGGRWVYSLLWNHADAGDFEDTNTIYEGIDMRTLTFAASYYFMRNVKAVIELNVDLLKEKDRTGPFFTGHLTNEHYVLFGFDAAF